MCMCVYAGVGQAAIRCSMLQRVAACCSVLQRVAVYCSAFKCGVVFFFVLQCVEVHISTENEDAKVGAYAINNTMHR